MKAPLFACLCLILGTSFTFAREFVDLQGRKLDAELVSVVGGQATLKRTADNRVFTLPVTSFSEADQKFINKFAAANVNYAFDIAYTKKKIDSATHSSRGEVHTTENWSYNVRIRNKQPVELQNLRVNYWLFRKEDLGKGKGNARVATSGSHKMESIKGSAIYSFDTLPVSLDKTKLEGGFFYIDGSRPRSMDVMAGVVLRVYDSANREVFKFATEEDLYAAAVGQPRGNSSNVNVSRPK